MGGSPICFSRNRSTAPVWSLTYNCQIITSSYEHLLLKLMRCLWKNIFTTCFWTLWDILSWKLQMGSLWEKLRPALSRYAHLAPCWQEHWPLPPRESIYLLGQKGVLRRAKPVDNTFAWMWRELPHCSKETRPLLQFPGIKRSSHVKLGWPS